MIYILEQSYNELKNNQYYYYVIIKIFNYILKVPDIDIINIYQAFPIEEIIQSKVILEDQPFKIININYSFICNFLKVIPDDLFLQYFDNQKIIDFLLIFERYDSNTIILEGLSLFTFIFQNKKEDIIQKLNALLKQYNFWDYINDKMFDHENIKISNECTIFYHMFNFDEDLD